jgi:hypothetical protein
MFISDQKCSNRLQTVAAIEAATVVTMKLAIRLLFMRLTTPKIGLRFVVWAKYYNSVFLSAISGNMKLFKTTNDKRQMTNAMAPPLLPHARSEEGEECL